MSPTFSDFTIDFAPDRFTPGQKFIFGIEIGTPNFNRLGTAYGRELAGTIAEITFSDGTVLTDSYVALPTNGGVASVLGEGLKSIAYSGTGDENIKRDQGQIVIQSNIISNSDSRKGGAILFFTTLALTLLPTAPVLSFMVASRLRSIRTEL